ncbi:AAA family ATPase [Lujinxingia vulgaris]|uniref:AAA family ATPase n=2 Tax=Lujinxingia TaxID=2653226 RepID=A0A5C6WU29_9DELT|nr:AAA family ATPase [Lujinxingia vulgaris]
MISPVNAELNMTTSPRHFIALAGNIGAGKSTAAKIIARHFGCELFHEPVVDNRFLRNYYGDMTRWSFTLQMEFLLRRVEHHGQIDRMRASCVQDRTLIEDPEIFAKYLHGLGHMTDNELDLYFDFFKRFNHSIRQPNKVILLHTPDTRVLLKRIAERGREEERGITSDFLRGLNGYYETFAQVARRKYGLDVLEIDVTSRDFRSGQERKRFLGEVAEFINRDLAPNEELPLAMESETD